MSNWITINKRLLDAVQLINATPNDIFNEIVSHACKNSDFDDKQLSRYKTELNLDNNSVQLLTQSVAHIFSKSARYVFRPNELQTHLEDSMKMDGEKSELMVKKWMEMLTNDFGDLGSVKTLDTLNWELNLGVRNESTKPKARLQFNETQTIEMDQNDLLQFYSMLETVQNRLDAIQKS